MELEEIRTSDRRFPHPRHDESCRKEGEQAQLRGEHAEDYRMVVSPVVERMEFSHHHQQQQQKAATTTTYDSSSYRRPSRQELQMGHHHHDHHHHRRFPSSESSHLLALSRSASSLSDVSCGSDSDTAATMKSTSTKSSPSGSDCSSMTMNNYYSRMDSGKGSSPRTPGGFGFNNIGGEMQHGDDRMHDVVLGSGWSNNSTHNSSLSSSSPSAEELREVFSWVDENGDGLISGADLRGFMTRVLAFEISEDEAESLLLFYGNGRTLRSPSPRGLAAGGLRGRGRGSGGGGGGGAVVDFEGFLSLYQCLCGEQASPEEQSMMAAASRVFDKTQLQSGRWV